MDDTESLAVARWLQREVRRRELTQGEAAKKIGVRPSVFGRWYHGTTVPSTASCHRIAEGFDVSPDHVLGLAGHRAAPDDPDDPKAELLAAIEVADLTPEWVKMLRETVETARRSSAAVRTAQARQEAPPPRTPVIAGSRAR